MPMEMTKSFDLGEAMLSRTSILIQMMKYKLSLDLVRQFSLSDIIDGCKRIDSAALPTDCFQGENIQRELIQNANFAAYYAKLLDAVSSKEKEDNGSAQMEQQASEAGYTAKKRIISSSMLMYKLEELLDCCRKNDRDITTYPVEKMLKTLSIEKLYVDRELMLLDNFSSQEFSGAKWYNASESLCICIALPKELTTEQKNLLIEPFVATREMFAEDEFGEIWAVIEKCPALISIMRLMHERGIVESLGLREYKIFMDNAQERNTHLEALANILGPQRMSTFLDFWARGACSMNELKQVEKCLPGLTIRELEYVFASYSSYANMLYKNRFKVINLADISDDKGVILVYAMSHKKKHFISLVDSNAELFHKLPQDSVLFQRELYGSHFNLNELTVKDLSDCIWMKETNLHANELQEGRVYTFPELKALYGIPPLYSKLYHMLTADSHDYRLRVLKQLQKRNLLAKVAEESLPKLASRLDIKPLYDWMQDDFKHIQRLVAEDAVQMLAHYEEIMPLLTSIKCRVDVSLVLRNLKSLKEFDSLEELKDNMAKIDTDWKMLAQDMQLSDEFQQEYRENIISFLCNNGAQIARHYQGYLEEKLQKAYQRVVKAELMGKLSELKYFEGDLQKELDMPLNNLVVNGWKQNLAIAEDNMEVKEYDDFFSTMMLGVQPQRTCMSYIDGMYRACLLSAFDSNKKVLYVTSNERIVARAFLRLTKGRLTERKGNSNFTFVDLEDIAGSREEDNRSKESLVLFLERPYFGGINSEGEYKAEKLLVDLACRKANELGTMLVVSTDYRGNKLEDFMQTRFYIFISKTKAGAQYLDSLDGQATVDTEGSYKANTFLIRNR